MAIHNPPADPGPAARFAALRPGDALPERMFKPTMAELFLYSAVIWNAHRIHYDHAYVTEVEGYPGIVITGPLQGDWLSQTVMEWLGSDGELLSYSFTHREAAYLGETLLTGGEVAAMDESTAQVTLRLFVRNEAGRVITPGEAMVRFAVQER